MDFVVGLPISVKGANAIWVIIDHITKSTHFLPVKTNFSMTQYEDLYIKEIVRLNGIPISIVSDRDPRKLAHRVALPPNLAGVHNVFHVSMLRKHMANLSHVLKFEPLQLFPNPSYKERPIQILDKQEKRLWNKVTKLVRVKWLNHSDDEATWEAEDEIRTRYPELFGMP
ncbi:uncharacterized protein LOC142537536 [Primulina tabacum]|uniref:uncharacterized protein LOC142537536 n=1 Tax=Primulina tabacum TaxID=48773 RepID=UPI003F5A34D9